MKEQGIEAQKQYKVSDQCKKIKYISKYVQRMDSRRIKKYRKRLMGGKDKGCMQFKETAIGCARDECGLRSLGKEGITNGEMRELGRTSKDIIKSINNVVKQTIKRQKKRSVGKLDII